MKTLKKFLFYIIFFTFFIFVSNITFTKIAFANTNKKNILILNPSSDSAFHNSLFEGVKTTLDDYPDEFDYHMSGLSAPFTESRLNDFNALLKNQKIDLIICLNGKIASLLKENYHSLYKDIPIIYGAVNTTLKPQDNFLGIYMNYDLQAYMDKVLKLHPKTTKINFLVDTQLKKTFFYDEIANFVSNNSSKYDFNIIQAGPFDDISHEFQGNNTLTIVYSTIKSKVRDGVGYRHASFFGSSKHIAKFTTNPIYGGIKDFGTTFNTGAFNFCGYSLGQEMIHEGMAFLRNEKPLDPVGVREFKKEKPFFINSALASEYGLSLDNHKDFAYYDYRDTTTLFSEKESSITFLCISILVFLLLVCIIIIFYNHKLYKTRVSSEIVKTNFIANISHELRTPLNIILSTIQLLPLYESSNKLTVNDPIVHDKFRYLKKNSLRLLRLVNNVIDFTKIDAGFSKPVKKFYNIVEVVEDITLSSIDYAIKNKVTLTFDTSSEEIISFFDRDQIERVILNLLSNALKFTPADGSVLVTVSELKDNVIISVSDTGLGIPADDLKYIFERFRQVESNILRKNEGSGIGLSLCKSMVELNGGTISIKSTLDVGSEFIVSLPMLLDKTLVGPSLVSNISEKVNLEYSDFIIDD